MAIDGRWCIYWLRPKDYKNDNNFYIGKSSHLETDYIMLNHHHIMNQKKRKDLTAFHNHINKNGGFLNWECFIIEIFSPENFGVLDIEKHYQTILNPKWKNNIEGQLKRTYFFRKNDPVIKSQYFDKDYINFIYNFNNINMKVITELLRKEFPDELIMLIFSFLKAEDINKKFPEMCECGAYISSNIQKHKRTKKHLDIVDGPVKTMDDFILRGFRMTEYPT